MGAAERKRNWLEAAATAFAVSAVLFGVIPLQSYLANAGSFEYGLPRLVREILPGLAVAFVALTVALATALRAGKRWVALAALGIAFAALMEAGPLAIGLPEFDGRIGIYKSHSRQVWDLAAWGILVGIPVLLRKKLSDYVTLIAAALTLYAVATVFDVRRDDSARTFRKEDGYLIESMMSQPEVMESVCYSAKRNVFLLIIDSMPTHVATDILKKNPAIAKKFDGFVDFADNLGMHWPTRMAVPGMFTGKYYTAADTLRNFLPYTHLYMMKGSFLEDYLAADCPTFMTLDMGYGGYTNRRAESGGASKREPGLRMTGALAWTVGEISVFRALPYVAKRHYLRRVMHRWRRIGADGWLGADADMWPELAKRPVRTDWDCTLQIHHTWGVHPPAKGGIVKAGTGVLTLVGDFLDTLRAKGIYDTSTILVVADHGIRTGTTERRHTEIPENAFPMLMVKVAGAKEPVWHSDAPTTHAGLADVLRALRSADLDEATVTKLLCRERRLVRDGRKGTVTDWTLGPDGTVTTKTHKEK